MNLEGLILRQVELVSTIYTDGWGGYRGPNALGYHHFSVIHQDAYTKKYRNINNPDNIVTVDTNTIEGSWQHAKAHFKRIHGTRIKNFEAHLSEVIWKNHNRGNQVSIHWKFFDLMRNVYHLQGPSALTVPHPLFDTWKENTVDLPEDTELKVVHVGSQDYTDQPKDQPFDYTSTPATLASETASQASATPRLDLGNPAVIPEMPPQPLVAQGLHVFMPEGYQQVTPEAGSREEKSHEGQGKNANTKKKKIKKQKKLKHDDERGSQRHKMRIDYCKLANMLSSDSDFE